MKRQVSKYYTKEQHNMVGAVFTLYVCVCVYECKHAWTHIANSGSLGIVEEGNEVISRVWNNCTQYTCNISCCKTHSKLLIFAALIFGGWNGVFVDHLHNSLKRSKFHHCVWHKPKSMCECEGEDQRKTKKKVKDIYKIECNLKLHNTRSVKFWMQQNM